MKMAEFLKQSYLKNFVIKVNGSYLPNEVLPLIQENSLYNFKIKGVYIDNDIAETPLVIRFTTKKTKIPYLLGKRNKAFKEQYGKNNTPFSVLRDVLIKAFAKEKRLSGVLLCRNRDGSIVYFDIQHIDNLYRDKGRWVTCGIWTGAECGTVHDLPELTWEDSPYEV